MEIVIIILKIIIGNAILFGIAFVIYFLIMAISRVEKAVIDVDYLKEKNRKLRNDVEMLKNKVNKLSKE